MLTVIFTGSGKMSDFNTSLLREKFVIQDLMPDAKADAGPVIALSNRMALPLRSDDGLKSEIFIVRAQNMHSCARMAAFIAKEFQEKGPVMEREPAFDWNTLLDPLFKGFEQTWNPRRWVAVYHKGRVVFQTGEHHQFLDVIEQCDARNKGDYEKAMMVAQDAFSQAGKIVNIKHDANVALVVSITPDEGKCGLILRGPNRTTTFNMLAKRKGGSYVRISQCLTAAAAYLEGVQLAFQVGMIRQKLRYELIDERSNDAKQAEEGSQRLGRLNAALSQFENLLTVNYRPDRPNFGDLITDAENFARKALASEIEKRIAEGAEDPGEWIL
jgi:hypothetical protein